MKQSEFSLFVKDSLDMSHMRWSGIVSVLTIIRQMMLQEGGEGLSTEFNLETICSILSKTLLGPIWECSSYLCYTNEILSYLAGPALASFLSAE